LKKKNIYKCKYSILCTSSSTKVNQYSENKKYKPIRHLTRPVAIYGAQLWTRNKNAAKEKF
jgi:hypothetical protein